MIKTKSALGSNAEIFLRFYTDQKTDAGGINIMFSRPPQYQLLNCSNLINFKQDLPTTLEKTWSITVNKTAGIRMMVHCNGELVIDEQLSEQMCSSNSLSWSRYWSGYMKRVKFTAEDTASTHYKPTIGNCTVLPKLPWQKRSITDSMIFGHLLTMDLYHPFLLLAEGTLIGVGHLGRFYIMLYNSAGKFCQRKMN